MTFFNKILSHKYGLLYIALAGGVICTLCHLIFSVDLYRDSASVYAFMARALIRGNYQEAFHESIPHLTVCCSYPFSLLGMPPEKSVSVVSCLFYLATIPYLFFLLREFVPEKLAGFGTILFAFAPKVIRFFCTALLDSGKVFFLVAGLYYGYKLVKNRFDSWRTAAGFGAALGLLGLVRSEGIGNAVLLGGCVAIYGIVEMCRSKKSAPLLKLLLSMSIALILLASRVVLMGVVFGKWIYDKRIADGLGKLLPFLKIAEEKVETGVVAVKQFDSSWGHLWEQNIRGAYEVYLVFTIIGAIILALVIFLRDKERLFPDKKVPEFIRWNNFYWVFILSIICNMLFFKAAGILAFRYFLLNIPLLMVCTLIGMYWVWSWLSCFIPLKILILCLVIVLPLQIANGLSRCFNKKHRIDHTVGLYLKKHLEPGKAISIDKAAATWYYSGLERAIRVESAVNIADVKDFTYIISPDDYTGIKTLETRTDLQEIKIPVKSNVRVFKKIK